MKKFLRKMLGIDDLINQKAQAEVEAKAAFEEARQAKLTPKERANENKEPFIQVMETHVNGDNPRNGFFELDWNEYFVVQLKSAGYFGETEEEIVDQWFQDLCRNIGNEAGVDMDRRGSGYINRALRDDGRTEVS